MTKATQPINELLRDLQGNAVQIGSTFSTQDESGTPKTSPLSYSSTEIEIVIPQRAVEMILSPTSDLRISEVTGMARYDIIQGGTKEALCVAKLDSLFIKRDAADGTLRFRFTFI